MANSTDDVLAFLSAVRPYGATLGATPDSRAGFQVWDFDTVQDEFAYIDGILQGWDGTTNLKLKFSWISSTATAGNVQWEAAFWLLDDEDVDVDGGWAGAASQGVSSDAPGTCGQLQYTEIEFTAAQIDGITNGKEFRILIQRDVSEDNMAGDAELRADSFRLLAA